MVLMALVLHVAADDGPVEDVECSEQGRGAMVLVVVRHGAVAGPSSAAGRAGCDREAGFRLFSWSEALMAARPRHRDSDDVAQFVDELDRSKSLLLIMCAKPCAFQMR